MDPVTHRTTNGFAVTNPLYVETPPPPDATLAVPTPAETTHTLAPEPEFKNLDADKDPVIPSSPPEIPLRRRIAGLIALVAVAAVVAGVLVMHSDSSGNGAHPANSTGGFASGQVGGIALTLAPTTALPTSTAPTDTPTVSPTISPTSSQPSVAPSMAPSAVPTWSDPTSSPSLSPPIILVPETSTTIPSGRVVLAAAGSMQLLRLVRVNTLTGDKLLAGRSYDTFEWESAPPENLVFVCNEAHEGGVYRTAAAPSNSTLCSTQIPLDDGTFVFKIEAFDFSQEAISDRAAAVRFLQKFTFGATLSEIDQLVNEFDGDLRNWFISQVNERPTSFRELQRRHVNRRYPSKNLPGLVGGARGPCDEFSRWHPHTFTEDDVNQVLEIRAATPGYFGLYINDHLRTVVQSADWDVISEDDNHTICRVNDWLGRRQLRLGTDCDIAVPNPPIMFVGDFTPDRESFVVTVDTAATFGSALNWTRSDSVLLPSPSLSGVHTLCENTSVFSGELYLTILDTGEILKFDRRLQIVENTMENPTSSLNEATTEYSECPTVTKSFLNENSCIIGRPSCAVKRFSSSEFQLTPAVIRQFYLRSGKHVHYIQGLRLEDDSPSPCAGGVSRWMRRDAQGTTCAGQVDDDSTAIIAAKIDPSEDAPIIQDIEIENSNCTAPGGVTVLVGDKCWENVHPHENNVYDFSLWTLVHPGNDAAAAADRPPPISKWASYGLPFLVYPDHHPMSRWTDRLRNSRSGLNLLGTLNGYVDFVDLPTDVQTDEMAAMLGAEQIQTGVGSFETCGSPGEVANDPTEGAIYMFGVGTGDVDPEVDTSSRLASIASKQFSSMWYNVALSASDQLRQRVAWAWSQIIVVNDLRLEKQEPSTTFYDIFVRHAFGNYRDILREVSYSPLMGRMLSYERSRSYYFSGTFPDENYAREVMQLFSMGLYQMHDNGTFITDNEGMPLPTYLQDDIVTFARAWTGFERQVRRGNLEHRDAGANSNDVDPMQLKPRSRDRDPKVDLYGGYIGDGYALCRDLPPQSFLRIGAQYRYLGASPFPTQFYQSSIYQEVDNDRIRYEVTANSSLYQILCIPAEDGNCTFTSVITLTENYPCYDTECMMDTLSVVKLANAGVAPDGSRYDVFYEHVRQPCVYEAIPQDNFTVPLITSLGVQTRRNWEMMCSDTRVPVAGTFCCDSSTDNRADCGPILYSNEKVTFRNAAERCAAQGQELCTFVGTNDRNFRVRSQPGCDTSTYIWPAERPCHIKVEVNSNSGLVNLVHDIPIKPNETDFDIGNKKRFRVPWHNSSFPDLESGSCPAGCEQHAVSCVCNTDVVEEVVFTGNTSVPTLADVVSHLKVGFPNIAMFDNTSYELCTEAWCTSEENVFVYVPGETENIVLDANTVFKAVDENGKEKFFKNIIYTVFVGDEGRFKFRSPVTFFAAAERDYMAPVRDAFYETEAVLDHYLYHRSTPPFIARALIQKMVTSNPSPRYVESVAVAFKTGLYMGIGTGERGDMNATIAAIVLDREASSSVLDRDETYGGLREPLLKIIALQRSLELKPAADDVRLNFFKLNIQQDPLDAPSVFSFFQYDFAPNGPVNNAGLVAPEAQILTAPTVLNYVHAVLGLTKFGLSRCFSGIGTGTSYISYWSCARMRNVNEEFDPVSNALYYLSVNESHFPAAETPADIVNELDVLLTGGRSSPDTLSTIETTFNNVYNATGNTTVATRVAQGAFALTPEYQVVGGSSRQREVRLTENSSVISDTDENRPYKAIVYLFMTGGADSYNFLVPHSDCVDRDLYTEYSNVRTNMAISKASLLQINASRNESARDFPQPCSRFGMHPSLETVHRWYNAGDALWVANTGPLKEPITDAEDYDDDTKRPPQLFSHNIQIRLTQSLDASQFSRTDGVLGRMQEKLKASGYKTGMFSLKGMEATVLQPSSDLNFDVMNEKGVQALESVHADFHNISMDLTENIAVSPFAESWSRLLKDALERTALLSSVLEATDLETDWNPSVESNLADQLSQVAKVVKASTRSSGPSLDSDRDVFFVSIGGWDVHTDGIAGTQERLDEVDAALAAFEAEMKAQGNWNNVTIVQASEFGRTLTSNGQGVDHAWGGHYFIGGGPVKGGNILGEYPSSLLEDHHLMLGRGRVLPTTSWEYVWNAVGSWFGVPEPDMAHVIPNSRYFPQGELFSMSDMFKEN